MKTILWVRALLKRQLQRKMSCCLDFSAVAFNMRGPISTAIAIFLAAAVHAESPEDLLKQAYQLDTNNHDTIKAVALYKDFLKQYPDHSQVLEVHYRVGKALNDMGEAEEAITHFQIVVDSGKKQFKSRQEAFLLLGKINGSLKKYDAATSFFEKMLLEGAGLYEDEVLNLCGGYYAISAKYEEAAAKFNLLKRKTDSPLAEQAAYKLAMLWLKAEKLEFAVAAIEDLAASYPKNEHVPELLLQLADTFRRQKKFDKAVSVCEQLRSRFPKSLEASGASYILGLYYRERKELPKALETFQQLGSNPLFQRHGMAAEALLVAADIHYSDMADVPGSMKFFEEAARVARDSESERKDQILEHCYLRLAENYYQQKNYSSALEHYLFLRALNTKFNILGRIVDCQSHLEGGAGQKPFEQQEGDLEVFRKKIAENPGTLIAAEGEVYLLDHKFNTSVRNQRDPLPLVQEYEGILKKYVGEILKQGSLEAYIHAQIGACYSQGKTKEDLLQGITAYEKILEIDRDGPYKITALENIAALADRAGDQKKSMETYGKLYALTQQAKPDASASATAGQGKVVAEKRPSEYLKAMVSRADTQDLAKKSADMLKNIIQTKGEGSTETRAARLYLGELYYVQKDFSAAAKSFTEYVKIYGPKQNDQGDVEKGPWRPNTVDEGVAEVYEAALRVAHCWYMQGHEQNMAKAYAWIVKNFNQNNKHMAEAHYWLALELGKGQKGQTQEGKRALAEALWRNVVNPSFGFFDPKFKSQFYYWVGGSQYPAAQEYVKSAILKCGQILSELGDHDTAAGVFSTMLDRYSADHSRQGARRRDMKDRDEMDEIARYALTREYVALNSITRLIIIGKPYFSAFRDDRFRVSALKLLGFYAGKNEKYDESIEAYATLLDEYGTNTLDADGKPVPVPQQNRLRQGNYNWDGIRMECPKDLDIGEICYALGLLYWKQEKWDKAIKSLTPFIADPQLSKNKSRAKSLYMIGQSYYKLNQFTDGVKIIHMLIRDCPNFEAIEEAYIHASNGYLETKNWSELELITKTYVAEWPKSDRRPRMDLNSALARMGQGVLGAGLSQLKDLANMETFEDVRADACYHVGKHHLSINKPGDLTEAYQYLENSVKYFPREAACLALARTCVALKKWEKAKEVLERTLREFPKASRDVTTEAKKLLDETLKQIAKK